MKMCQCAVYAELSKFSAIKLSLKPEFVGFNDNQKIDYFQLG
jgi:hypothetical protein